MQFAAAISPVIAGQTRQSIPFFRTMMDARIKSGRDS
jgi:hypothetical protein